MKYTILKQAVLMFVLVAIASALVATPQALANRYPKNGVFKRLPDSKDYWYYVDRNNWEIVAPDKWVHMMGSMSSTALLSQMMNKYAAGALVLSFGIYKEYDDGYREGWSYRDVIMDALGVTASLTANDKYRLLCDYDEDKVLLKFSVTLD